MNVANLILTEHIGRLIAIEHNGDLYAGYLEDIIDTQDYPRFQSICEVVVDLSNPDPNDFRFGFHAPVSYLDAVTFIEETTASTTTAGRRSVTGYLVVPLADEAVAS